MSARPNGLDQASVGERSGSRARQARRRNGVGRCHGLGIWLGIRFGIRLWLRFTQSSRSIRTRRSASCVPRDDNAAHACRLGEYTGFAQRPTIPRRTALVRPKRTEHSSQKHRLAIELHSASSLNVTSAVPLRSRCTSFATRTTRVSSSKMRSCAFTRVLPNIPRRLQLLHVALSHHHESQHRPHSQAGAQSDRPR